LILFLRIPQGERCFLLLVCSAGVVWSDVVASLLESFSGITVAGGVRSASLEEWEAADEVQPPALGTAARMKTAP